MLKQSFLVFVILAGNLLGAELFAATEIKPGTAVGNVNSGDYQITKDGLHEGAFKLNGGTLTQSSGTIHPNADWMTLGQGGSPTWTLSGDAKAYMWYAVSTNKSTDGFHVATSVGADSSPVFRILPDSNVRFYSESLYVGNAADTKTINASFTQESGEVYVHYFNVAQNAAHVTCTYALSGGKLFIGSAGKVAATNWDAPPLNFTGGTLAFETWNGSLVNQGGTVEIYGNLMNSLGETETAANYSFESFTAGNAPAYTTYGTSAVTGSYVQSSGTLALDFNATTPASSDKLSAANISLTRGDVLVRTNLYTNYDSAKSFDGLDGTITSSASASVKASMTGVKWTLDASTGTFTTAMTAWDPALKTTISDGDYLTRYFGNDRVSGTFTMTGGCLTGRFYAQNGFVMNQSGGTTLINQTNWWMVLLQSDTTGQSAIWNLSNTAKFYVFDNQSWKSEDRRINIGKGYLGKITIADDAILHADGASLGVSDGTRYYGRGVIEQSGGEAYFNQLEMYARKNSLGTTDPSSLTITDGTLVVNSLKLYQPDTSATINPIVNLKGGNVTIAKSNLSLINEGSKIQIQSLGNTLDDFSYLNDGDDSTVRPIGFGKIGTMAIVGSYVQESGAIIFDISADSLTFDTLTADGGITFNGGDLFLEYDGSEALKEGATYSIFGDSNVTFGEDFSTLVSNQAHSLYWTLGADGAAFLGGPSAVPEPSAVLLLLLGLGIFVPTFTRRKHGIKSR